MGIEQRFLSVPGERLDPHLLPESGAPRFDLPRPHQVHRKPSASVPRRPPRPMLREALRDVLGDAGVQRAVAAAEDIHEGHGGMIASNLDDTSSMEHPLSMVTTVTQENMVTIPTDVGRKLGIKPGSKLDWQPVEGKDEILVRVIPDRGELARRLLGAGRKFSPARDSVAELVAERATEED